MKHVKGTIFIFAALLVFGGVSAGQEAYEFEKQDVVVPDFPAEGFILDLGGGGEGVIGRLKGVQAVAIDILKQELEDAPPGPLKTVMDARDLKFLDGSFNTATAFYMLMYVQGADHEKVFREVHRVLAPGGRFLIWEAVFPTRPDGNYRYGLVTLKIKLPSQEVETDYGGRWPDELHDLAYYSALARKTGFEVVRKEEKNGRQIYLELRKR